MFATGNHRRQKLSPLVDLINDRYGRCAIGARAGRRKFPYQPAARLIPYLDHNLQRMDSFLCDPIPQLYIIRMPPLPPVE